MVCVYSTDKQQSRSSNINQDLHKQTGNKEEDGKGDGQMKANTKHSNPEPSTPETIDNSNNNTNSIISSDVHADVSEATPTAPPTETPLEEVLSLSQPPLEEQTPTEAERKEEDAVRRGTKVTPEDSEDEYLEKEKEDSNENVVVKENQQDETIVKDLPSGRLSSVPAKVEKESMPTGHSFTSSDGTQSQGGVQDAEGSVRESESREVDVEGVTSRGVTSGDDELKAVGEDGEREFEIECNRVQTADSDGDEASDKDLGPDGRKEEEEKAKDSKTEVMTDDVCSNDSCMELPVKVASEEKSLDINDKDTLENLEQEDKSEIKTFESDKKEGGDSEEKTWSSDQGCDVDGCLEHGESQEMKKTGEDDKVTKEGGKPNLEGELEETQKIAEEEEEDDQVLTFEEFKKKLMEQTGGQTVQMPPDQGINGGSSGKKTTLTNYASVDCGAKVVEANPEAQVRELVIE